MADLTISESLWTEFVALAQTRRRRPEALAESVLRDYLGREVSGGDGSGGSTEQVPHPGHRGNHPPISVQESKDGTAW